MMEVSIILNPVHSFAEQINGLVSKDNSLRRKRVKSEVEGSNIEMMPSGFLHVLLKIKEKKLTNLQKFSL